MRARAASSGWPASARASTAAARLATSRLSRPPGRRTPAATASASAGSSTTSSTLWHSSRSTLPAGDEVGQVGEVALQAGDPAGEPALGGAALQRGQRVGAGVDDGDPVAGARERHGEAAGAAAGVDDVEALAVGVGLGQDGGQHLPHHGGAGGRRRTADAAAAGPARSGVGGLVRLRAAEGWTGDTALLLPAAAGRGGLVRRA